MLRLFLILAENVNPALNIPPRNIGVFVVKLSHLYRVELEALPGVVEVPALDVHHRLAYVVVPHYIVVVVNLNLEV